MALAWQRQRAAGAVLIPVVGARSAAQIEESLGCLDLRLTDDQLARLDAVNPLTRGFPYDFLTDDEVRGLIFGDTFACIRNHRA